MDSEDSVEVSEEYFPVRCMSGEDLEDNGYDVRESLIQAILSTRPLVRDRPPRYKPSGLMACRRKVFYDRIGELQVLLRHDLQMSLYGEAGSAIHDRVQMLLTKYHDGEFVAETTIEGTDFPLMGYVDGEAFDWIIEFKSIGNASYATLSKPKDEHTWQVHLYMWFKDIPRAQILYINRDNWAMKNFKVKFDPDVWARIMGVIGFTEERVLSGEAPEKINKKWTCSKCEYQHVCKPEI